MGVIKYEPQLPRETVSGDTGWHGGSGGTGRKVNPVAMAFWLCRFDAVTVYKGAPCGGNTCYRF